MSNHTQGEEKSNMLMAHPEKQKSKSIRHNKATIRNSRAEYKAEYTAEVCLLVDF